MRRRTFCTWGRARADGVAGSTDHKDSWNVEKDGYPVGTALTLEQAIKQLMPLLEEGGRTHG